jgi:hypothetical protein
LPYCKFLANIKVLEGFFSSYDCADPSLRFREYMEIFNGFADMNIWDLVHRETPATNRSSQVNSKFVVFSEILAPNCALVFLEHHQPTHHS